MDVSDFFFLNIYQSVNICFFIDNRHRKTSTRDSRNRKKAPTRRRVKITHRSPPGSDPDDDDSDYDELPSGYHQVSIQVMVYIFL